MSDITRPSSISLRFSAVADAATAAVADRPPIPMSD